MSKHPKIRLNLQELSGSGWLSSSNSAYVETLFELYQEHPEQVSPEWQACFSKIAQGASWKEIALPQLNFILGRETVSEFTARNIEAKSAVQPSIMPLIEAFRTYGHFQAEIDPLKLSEKPYLSELTLEGHQLTADANTELTLKGVLGLNAATPSQVLEHLQSIYCKSIGFEYQHILDINQKKWLIERIEKSSKNIASEDQRRILQRLVESEGLEKHLGAQFVAQKRFSIEGGDTLMPMLDTLLREARAQNVQSAVLGMAHRGRLNVLINLLGKAPQLLFEEFEGKYSEEDLLSGDVKYHKGYQSQLETPHGTLEAQLAFNPSHLEIVNPVVEGLARAKQDKLDDVQSGHQQVLPILMHGDAAFAGQGVVMETLQLSQTKSCGTGGTLHIISNNQVGFTTDPHNARSSRYSSDAAKAIEAPILHVNGNDPEAACWAIKLALDFRMQFKKDIVIDLICYRRYGHNEADEPSATQPIMYSVIRKEPPVWSHYAKTLQAKGIIQAGEAENWLKEYRKRVATGKPVASMSTQAVINKEKFQEQKDWRISTKTQVSTNILQGWSEMLTAFPEDMTLQPQVGKLIADRRKMIQGDIPLNWGTAETLAYASLLSEGFGVRISGQDAERGTFAHRHAILHNYQTGAVHIPLAQFAKKPTQFLIADSILSEAASMGFEYGYSSEQPQSLVIWEAQYGDFVNGAQVVIDQFLSASEQKWGQRNGLVLFLPHGYEGSGPEHSSARLERFLQLCAQENLQVCAPTTPAQHFHLLRRQVLRTDYRKPLVVMAPKSLLRHKQATSHLEELANTSFQPILVTTEKSEFKKERIVLCSGKVYYDLLAYHQTLPDNIVLVRVEQLYPLPDKELKAVLEQYSQASRVIWCQEEPQNQGPWQWIHSRLQPLLSKEQTLEYVGRPEAASPAVGSPLRHSVEQKMLVKAALE